jgi:hypothetical protein
MYRPISYSDQVYSNLFIHILTKDDNSRFPTCKYYTSSSGSYTSFNYSFFNAPTSDNCSNPQIATGNELDVIVIGHEVAFEEPLLAITL